MLFVQGSSINKSLGNDTSETFDFSSTITIIITSARLPFTLPLLADEFVLRSSLPIIKYEVKSLSILFVSLLTNKLSYRLG